MKQFFKMMFASTLGFILASIIVSAILFVTMIGMVAGLSKSSAAAVGPKAGESVFKITLAGEIPETTPESPFSALVSGNDEALSMHDLVAAIRNAKEQETVKGIYLDLGAFSSGVVTLDAVRRALADFKESGKFVVAYADRYTQGGYYLASIADKVFLNPEGMLSLNGLSSQTTFVKGALEKIGVEMMIFRVGTYKGAVEQFMTDKLSDANREQITAYQRTIWGNITRSIAKSRKITADDVNRFADEGGALLDARKAVAYKLVDELKYRREVEQYLMDRAGQKGDKLKATSVAALKGAKKKEKEYRNKIAVVYAEGEIVESLPGGFSAGEAAITERLNDDLKKLEGDDDVKAVVLRVNSPGGSAYVSEQIWKAVSDQDRPNGITWGKPSKLNNTYALAVREEYAKEEGIEKLSDIAKLPPAKRTLCVDAEFNSRTDGLNPLLSKYGIPRGNPNGVPEQNVSVMDTGTIYTATDRGSCNFGEVFSTDGRIKSLNLRVLKDDLGFFPAYNVSPVYATSLVKKFPKLRAYFDQMAPLLTDDEMREMNLKVDVEGQDPSKVAREWLISKGFVTKK